MTDFPAVRWRVRGLWNRRKGLETVLQLKGQVCHLSYGSKIQGHDVGNVGDCEVPGM